MKRWNPSIFLTRGMPASGKTTWASLFVKSSQGNAKRVGKDDLRMMFDGTHDYGERHAKFLDKVRDALVVQILEEGFDVVVDETFARVDDLHRFGQRTANAPIHIVDFTDVPFETCVAREVERGQTLGADVLDVYNKLFIHELPKWESTLALKNIGTRSFTLIDPNVITLWRDSFV